MRTITKTTTFLAILLILAGTFVSCEDKESNDLPFGNPIEISFEKYLLEGTASEWKNLRYDKSVIPINSNEELKNYIAGNDFPAIDFSKHTLLLSSGQSHKWIMEADFLLWQTSHHKYTLELVAEAYTSKDIETWEYAILIPKLSEKAETTAEIQFNIVGAIDFSNIENLWKQPLPIIQRAVQGKWQLIGRYIFGGFVPYDYELFVEITKNQFIVTDADGEVVNVNTYCNYLYTWYYPNTFYYRWEKYHLFGDAYFLWDIHCNEAVYCLAHILDDELWAIPPITDLHYALKRIK
jgi:hypothetical protein